MDLIEYTKKICQKYNIRPSRTKGQNFLVSGMIYDQIIEAADLRADDIVLEVGPGLGFLTERLARNVKRVVAVELDDKLAGALRTRMAEQGAGNVEVVNDNILKISKLQFLIFNKIPNPKSQIPNKFQIINSKNQIQDRLSFANYKIVANLPYNITSIFLRKFLTAEIKPSLAVLMLQKEVAERVCARPPRMSLLAVSVQFFAEPEIVKYVDRSNFWPRPEVDSAIVKLKVKSKKLKVDEKRFFRLVKIGFSARRKMLKNNLGAGYHIASTEAEKKLKLVGFGEKVRAQELTVEDWVKLFGVLG